MRRFFRRCFQWVVCIIGLLFHGISFLILLIKFVLGLPIDPEEREWLRNNAGLDFQDHDGKIQTGTKDAWWRIWRTWREWRRIPHVLKNLPYELFKSRPEKYVARLCGFIVLLWVIREVFGLVL